MTQKVVVVDFNKFWKAYPKHTKVPAARGAWKRLNPTKELLAEMLTAITAQMKPNGILASRPDSGMTYVPSAASWLANERWLEMPDEQSFPDCVDSREFDSAEILHLGIYPELTADMIGGV